MSIIEVANLRKEFKIGFKRNQKFLRFFLSLFFGFESKKRIRVLRDISFSVDRGEIVGIVGKNGCGKTTLFKILSRIYFPSQGKIKINGRMVSHLNLTQCIRGVKARLTVREAIFFVGYLMGMSNELLRHNFNSILNFSELNDYVDAKAYQLSEGMMERLVLAIVFYSNSDILLLDEPFVNLDENFKVKAIQKICELNARGITFLIISHDLDFIKKYCKRSILLEDGRVLGDKSTLDALMDYKKLNK